MCNVPIQIDLTMVKKRKKIFQKKNNLWILKYDEIGL